MLQILLALVELPGGGVVLTPPIYVFRGRSLFLEDEARQWFSKVLRGRRLLGKVVGRWISSTCAGCAVLVVINGGGAGLVDWSEVYRSRYLPSL